MLVLRKDAGKGRRMSWVDELRILSVFEQAIAYFRDSPVSWLVCKGACQIVVEAGPVGHDVDVNVLESAQGVF